jgi:hypothetical protein
MSPRPQSAGRYVLAVLLAAPCARAAAEPEPAARVRPIAYAAFVNAFLAEVQPPRLPQSCPGILPPSR